MCFVLVTYRRMLVLTLFFVGCHRATSGVAIPEWDPAQAADRAISEYDTNSDDGLSRDELEKCPGLLTALDRIDTNANGLISGEELASTLREIRQQDAAMVEISCAVTLGGQPLEGARVTLVPEPFMGESVKSATGVTVSDGTTLPTVAETELPEKLRGRVFGVHCGVFKVEVTHPRVAIPARFNTQTELGRIVSRRDHETLEINL
jgi:hypothetical protein